MKKTIKTLLVICCLSLVLAFGFTGCKKDCEHTYDNACDTICNICNEERTITHDPNDDDGNCTTAITCRDCGTTTTPAKDSHTGGTATCTDKAECTVCGTAYGTVDANNHLDNNTDHICDRECGKTDMGIHADTNNDHNCEYGCSVYIGTHADSAEDNDHVCDYGCGETLEDHKGGTATCTEKAECTVCGTAYGTVDANNHLDSNTDHICDRECGKTDVGTHADTNNDHICEYGCTTSIGTHADSDEDNDHVCDYGCGATLEDCKGGIATCVSGKICDICKTVYSEVDSANHTSDKYIYTDNGNGTHTQKHECCGASAGEPVDHIYEYTYNTTDTHSFTCTVCDISGKEDHTFTDSTCTVCGLIDATEMTADSLKATVAKVLSEGKTDITVSLAANAPAKMFTAIRRAICDTEGVADGSIHLTLAGVTAIPKQSDQTDDYSLIFGNVNFDENGSNLDQHESVTQLASVNLPDVLTIGAKAFEGCQYLTALTAPKVQTIGKYAFVYTGLTSINLPEATTLEDGAFLGCSDIKEFNLHKVTVLGMLALDIDYWKLNTYNSERTIYLTSSDEIEVDAECFYDLAEAGLLETHVNLILNSNKQSEVSGNTWTTKDANGNTVLFTFKSITFVD